MRDDIPCKEYVAWLECRRDHWMEKAANFYYEKQWSHEKDHNKKLFEFARLVKECPANSVHLMPLAADTLLKQRDAALTAQRQAEKERDDARREACEAREFTLGVDVLSREEAARNRGWAYLYDTDGGE